MVTPIQLVARLPADKPLPPVSITPEIMDMVARNSPVAIGISGGKDSQACALEVIKYLRLVGHSGPQILVHSDLGRVEWKDSLPACERLADHLGLELMIVRRQAGDMLARWQGRWANNLARYSDLSCVKLILPWSTPSMRFCTSELKHQIICSALKKRFPGQDIINVTGVRREESPARMKMPVASKTEKLSSKANTGYTWNGIIDYKIGEVLASVERAGLDLHEAYTKYGTSRVSCVYCIMSSTADLLASSGCADNHEVLIQMVELEAASTFAFQGARWLADTAPNLLPGDLRDKIAYAKSAAIVRREAEARIPKHLLYTKGWPTCMPTRAEAELLAEVRQVVSGALKIKIYITDPDVILERYDLLLAEKYSKDSKNKQTADEDQDEEESNENAIALCGM